MSTAVQRPAIVVVGTAGCPWCDKLKDETDPSLYYYLDAEKAMTSGDARKTNSPFVTTVKGMPTTFTLDKASDSYNVTCTGYMPPDQWYEKVRPSS